MTSSPTGPMRVWPRADQTAAIFPHGLAARRARLRCWLPCPCASIARMTEVLKGVHVVELGTMITAPLAAMMLADLGAQVIKVEHPDGGDPFRSFRGGHYSPHFVAYNRGKRSIRLDLRNEAGRAVLLKLLSRADVLIENY